MHCKDTTFFRRNIPLLGLSLIRTYGDLLSFMKSLKYEQELYSGTLPEIGRIPYYHLLQKNSLSPFLPFKDFENEGEIKLTYIILYINIYIYI